MTPAPVVTPAPVAPVPVVARAVRAPVVTAVPVAPAPVVVRAVRVPVVVMAVQVPVVFRRRPRASQNDLTPGSFRTSCPKRTSHKKTSD